MSNQSSFTLATLITAAGRRVGVTLEWDGDCVKDARRRIALPSSTDSIYKTIEVPTGTQMPRLLQALGYAVIEKAHSGR